MSPAPSRQTARGSWVRGYDRQPQARDRLPVDGRASRVVLVGGVGVVMATIYHGTPLTPRAALLSVCPGRAMCVSFYRPDSVRDVEAIAPAIMYDNGAFSFWQQALRCGEDWDDQSRDWSPYYAWLEHPLFWPGRWAVIPDAPGAPSQLNDALLKEWPFGRSRGTPLWHMDGPINRLADLCERYDRVALGWIGHPKREPVGCDRYRQRMDDVASILGNRWPVLHMMRGVAVANDYPFASADSTSLAQNGWRYDSPMDALWGLPGPAAQLMRIGWSEHHDPHKSSAGCSRRSHLTR